MQSASEQVIPAGMKPWSGGDQKPVDWDGGPVLLANGKIDTWPVGHQWLAPFGDNYVIAYTPKPLPSPAPMVEQAGEVIQADREAEADEYRMRRWEDDDCEDVIRKIRSGELDIWTSIQERARHRLNTRPAPAETEGVGREEIARIIDPEAFKTLREIAAEKGLDAANPPVGVVLLDPIDAPRLSQKENCAAALTKADRILAALSTPPADAGMLREALEEAASKATPELVHGPSLKALTQILTLGAEHQRPRSRQFSSGNFNGEADAAFIVAAIAFARAALNSQARQIREGDHE